MDPRVRLGLLACVGVLAVVLDRPQSLGLLVLLSAAPFAVIHVPGGWRSRGLIAALTLVWGTVLSQGFFYADEPRTALVRIGPLSFWREGALHGLVQSLRFVSVTLAGVAVAVSTPVDRLLAAMLSLKIPFGIAFLSVTALRFVPEGAREALVVRRARARRGRPIAHRAPLAWIREELALVRPVVARALRRARTLAEALDARGFDAMAPRAVRRSLRMRTGEGLLLAFVALLTGAAVGLRALYVLYGAEVLYLPRLRWLYGFVRTWL
ncbi:MAG: energy-coupling factor transporter transmembrane protein EcfT [Deltaproteobacteria bacterium]|nr:energy-coupling factor transporter transmembrane protein EcfT [Deltaproteobacteria bacterium]